PIAPSRPWTVGRRSSHFCRNTLRANSKGCQEVRMCSYIVEKAVVAGSAKGANGWMRIDTANVYYDHPYHAPFDHSLNIDFVCEADGGRERVAVELSAESA